MVVIFLLLTPAHSTLPTDESQMQTEVLQIQAHIISHAKIIGCIAYIDKPI
jgi:hypothetical protein